MSRIKMEIAKCAYCNKTFVRSVRNHPRQYCRTICERRHQVKPVAFSSLPAGDFYEDREHIQLDYEGKLETD